MTENYVVRGESMRNTLPSGTTIVVELADESYSVGDIVVVIVNGDLIVKRITLSPGGKLDDFCKYPILKEFSEQWGGVLPEDQYLIQGDIPASLDSTRIGPININDIVGRVVKSYA